MSLLLYLLVDFLPSIGVRVTITRLAARGVPKMRIPILIAAISVAAVSSQSIPAQEKKASDKTAYAKPQMKSHFDFDGSPERIYWGADQKVPYIFVSSNRSSADNEGVLQSENSFTMFRFPLERAVPRFTIRGGHRIVEVFPNDMAVVTAQIETGRINVIRELRYWDLVVNGDLLKDQIGEKTAELKERTNWLDPSKVGPIGAVPLDDLAGNDFKLTPDAKGIWNTYFETNDDGTLARSGVRLLHPITGKILRRLQPIDGRIVRVIFDPDCRYAIAAIVGGVESGKEVAMTSGAICWDLQSGKVAWEAAAPREWLSTTVAISADAKVAAVAFYLDQWYPANKGGGAPGIPAGGRQDLPPRSVRVVDAATGKTMHEVDSKSDENPGGLHLSHDGSLMVINMSPYAQFGVTTYAQVWNTSSRKQIYRWAGSAIWSFLPVADTPTLVIAESRGRQRLVSAPASGVVPGGRGLGGPGERPGGGRGGPGGGLGAGFTGADSFGGASTMSLSFSYSSRLGIWRFDADAGKK